MLVFPVLLPGPGWWLYVVGRLVGHVGVDGLPGGGWQYGSVVCTPVPTAQYSPQNLPQVKMHVICNSNTEHVQPTH